MADLSQKKPQPEEERKKLPWIKKAPNRAFFGQIKKIRFPGAQHRG